MRSLLACALATPMLVACGAGNAATTTNATTASSTATPASAPTTTEGEPPTVAATVDELTSYRFSMELGLTQVPGSVDIESLGALMGAATAEPERLQIFGEIAGEAIDLVHDGARWWDRADPSLDLTDEGVEFFLAGNGFLLRSAIDPLLADAGTWTEGDNGEHLGLTVTAHTRPNVRKDIDWEYGDLAQIEVWRDGLDQVVKFTAWFATGDNAGFPVATWELIERNPTLTIEVPEDQ